MVREYLVRVEGEGEVVVYVDENGVARRVEYRFTEAPRFFEYIVRGLSYTQVPEVVSRICGFCGVSYILCAARAFEACLGMEVPEEVEFFRDIVHLAERVKSHVLHVVFMNLPDLLGVSSILEVEKINPQLFKLAISLATSVDKLMRLAGGRFHNVVNIRIGGVYGEAFKISALGEFVKRDLIPKVEVLASKVLELAELAETACSVPRCCTVASERYPGSGESIYVGEERLLADEFYEKRVEVHQRLGCNTLRYRYRGDPFLVGPLPRYNRYLRLLRRETRSLLENYGWLRPLNSVFQSVVARIAEIYDALLVIEEATTEVSESRLSAGNQYSCSKGEKWCFHVIEAPRGVLYLSFLLSETGRVLRANIVTPTAQNVEAAESLSSSYVSGRSTRDAAERAKRFIVNLDPCISCSVHTLKVRLVTLNSTR